MTPGQTRMILILPLDARILAMQNTPYHLHIILEITWAAFIWRIGKMGSGDIFHLRSLGICHRVGVICPLPSPFIL